MQVKGVRLYAKDDIRLEEFELPEIKDDEIRLASPGLQQAAVQAVGLVHPTAYTFQGSAHEATDGLFILDQQNGQKGFGASAHVGCGSKSSLNSSGGGVCRGRVKVKQAPPVARFAA